MDSTFLYIKRIEGLRCTGCGGNRFIYRILVLQIIYPSKDNFLVLLGWSEKKIVNSPKIQTIKIDGNYR